MIRFVGPFLLLILIAFPRPVAGQWVVIDPAAIVKIFEQTQETIKIVTEAKKTATSLTTPLLGLGAFRLAPVPPQEWSVQQSIPAARAVTMAEAEQLVAAMAPGPAREFLQQQLSLIFVSARSGSHANKAGDLVREDLKGQLGRVIQALSASMQSSGADAHSVAAELGRIAMANGVQLHALDGLTQVNLGILDHLAIQTQRMQNADQSALNSGLTTQANAVAFGTSTTKGSAEILRHFNFGE